MNQLQQEMKNFHENLRPVLEKILEQYDRKASPNIYHTIIKPCKQLIQKCSFKSLSDTSSLCSLVYWLYIYDYKELALEICEHTHDVDFVFEDQNDCGYPEIYGLFLRSESGHKWKNKAYIHWKWYRPNNTNTYTIYKEGVPVMEATGPRCGWNPFDTAYIFHNHLCIGSGETVYFIR